VQRAPGIPHALLGRIVHAQLGRNARRDGEGVCSKCRRAKLSASSPATGSRECAPDDRLQRATQYSETPMLESRSCGVLDTPLSRSMTTSLRIGRLKSDGLQFAMTWKPPLPQHDPRRGMVAGAFFAARLAVDAGLDQAGRQRRAQQEMIEPQSGIARPSVALVIPEREHRL
jgi:hypothetical protein